jgi:16S rRNA (cytosine1402-N4)-methyltransferase
VLAHLRPQAGQAFFDGTCGGAGHSAAILQASSPTGFLYACDQDGDAIAAATERLAPFAGRFELRRLNFADATAWVPPGSCAGVLIDCGISSFQIDEAGRGFSFQQEGPLDARMDQRTAVTAAAIVNTWPVEELANLIWKYGDERESRRIARAIETERKMRSIDTTRQLASLIEQVCPRADQLPGRLARVFQAIRIVVNDEMEVLRRGLVGAFTLLEPGGRLAVITFHSLEDRLVKEFMREQARDYDLPPGQADFPHLRIPRAPRAQLLTRKPISPGAAELATNPRSRSAHLRVLEKL